MEDRITENQNKAIQQRSDELVKLDNRFGPLYMMHYGGLYMMHYGGLWEV